MAQPLTNQQIRIFGFCLAAVGAGVMQIIQSGSAVPHDTITFNLPIGGYTWVGILAGSFVAANGIKRWRSGPKDLAANVAKVGVTILAVALFFISFMTYGNASRFLFEEFYRIISHSDSVYYLGGEFITDHGETPTGARVFWQIFYPFYIIPALIPVLAGFGLSKALRTRPMASEAD